MQRRFDFGFNGGVELFRRDLSESIVFVQKTKHGKFQIDWIFNDEIVRIHDDGTFYYSSYENGIIQYDKDEKRWCHDFYHSRKRLDDYVGFMKIVFNDENAYNVEPPDLETYKDENIVQRRRLDAYRF